MLEPTTGFSIFDHQELVNWITAGGPINGIRAVQRPLTQTVGRRIEQFVSLIATDVAFHLDAAPLAAATLAVIRKLACISRAKLPPATPSHCEMPYIVAK